MDTETDPKVASDVASDDASNTDAGAARRAVKDSILLTSWIGIATIVTLHGACEFTKLCPGLANPSQARPYFCAFSLVFTLPCLAILCLYSWFQGRRVSFHWQNLMQFNRNVIAIPAAIFALQFADRALQTSSRTASDVNKVNDLESKVAAYASLGLLAIALTLWSARPTNDSRIAFGELFSYQPLIWLSYNCIIHVDNRNSKVCPAAFHGSPVAALQCGNDYIWFASTVLLNIWATRQYVSFQMPADGESEDVTVDSDPFWQRLWWHITHLETRFARFVWWFHVPLSNLCMLIKLADVVPMKDPWWPFHFFYLWSFWAIVPMLYIAELREVWWIPRSRGGYGKEVVDTEKAHAVLMANREFVTSTNPRFVVRLVGRGR